MRKIDAKFNFCDKVAYEDKVWYIIGVCLKRGYDHILWEYAICKGVYGDYDPFTAGRCDFDSKFCVPEDKLIHHKDFLLKEKEKTQKRIDELKEELRKLEVGDTSVPIPRPIYG